VKVLIAAGASGGHVYPGLATAVVLRERGHDVSFAGGDRLEARVVPEAGFEFHPVPVRRPPSVRLELLTPRGIRSLGSIGLGTVRARILMRRLSPDVVLSMGGFASVPVALAAAGTRGKGAALVLHEQNAHLSFAQRIPLRWADALAMGLPIEERVTHARLELVGNPVREPIAKLASLDDAHRTVAQHDARSKLGLDPSRKTLLVLGGSLGSGPLNETLPTVALPAGVQVLHLCGPAHEEATRRAWSGSATDVTVIAFSGSMQDVYLASDLAVSRSGASTVSELAIAALPSILVPLLTLARGDQAANARVLERAGGAVVIEQSRADFADRIGTEVTRLLSDDVSRVAMGRAARTVARPDAAARLADLVESVATS
jgi:UDP-N-acetylglucosamine--N-acetylmuramyl-(pentapeptide) pyrophosphoryl-undecaprenol N-acetylglucosamine transferase